MGQVLHGSATTTATIRRAIQHSQESLRGLSKRYGINQKTVAKWKKRAAWVDRLAMDLCHGLIDRLLPVLIGGDDMLRRRRRVRAETISAG
jgi:hypothetical protein